MSEESKMLFTIVVALILSTGWYLFIKDMRTFKNNSLSFFVYVFYIIYFVCLVYSTFNYVKYVVWNV